MCLIVYFLLVTASPIPNRAKERSPSSRYKCWKYRYLWRIFHIGRERQRENDKSQTGTFDSDVHI